MGRFLASQWPYALLLPVLIPVGTIVHESAHALAIVMQGGRVTRFDVIPGGEPDFSFGSVSWVGDDLILGWLVSLAPTLLAFTLAASAAALAPLLARRNALTRVALVLFFWLPIVDTSMAAGGLFTGRAGSDWQALGGLEILVAPAFGAWAALFGEIGWRLFLKAWGPVLSSAEYTLGYLLLLALPWLVYAFH